MYAGNTNEEINDVIDTRTSQTHAFRNQHYIQLARTRISNNKRNFRLGTTRFFNCTQISCEVHCYILLDGVADKINGREAFVMLIIIDSQLKKMNSYTILRIA